LKNQDLVKLINS